MRRNTKQIIADAFTRGVLTSSLAHVHIADLIQELGINRNTFYYHFASKYDVALWILEQELSQQLEAEFEPDELIYLPATTGESKARRIAYYARVESGAHALDESRFMKAFVRCVSAHKDFYRKLINPQEIEFKQYLFSRYYPALEDDIRFILGGRYMPETTMRMLATIGTRTIILSLEFCLSLNDGEEMLDDRVYPFWNLYHEALSAAIIEHPINRYSSRRN